jgi:hypothetical protein
MLSSFTIHVKVQILYSNESKINTMFAHKHYQNYSQISNIAT